MATTVTGKLNKAATQFQAGESTGFGLRLGVKYYDREIKMDQWCNYEAVVFAKAPAQIQFYQQALVEGAIVEISGDKQRIRQFQGANGLSLSIELLDAKLGFIGTPGIAPQQGRAQQPVQAQAPAAPAYNRPAAPAQQAYQQPAPQQQAYNQQPPQQPMYNQAPQQPAYNQPQHAPQQGFNQPQQGGFGQQRGPMDQPIDFDDDIPF